MQNPAQAHGPQRLGRYAVFAEIASGGMASVHLGRLMGSAGFTRTVAIKRLHPHLARNPDFVAMFLDEARLAARIRHPNVVHTLDVVSDDKELLLVMEYVHGETLARLIRAANTQKVRLPPPIVAGILVGALDGLHAAHEATSERGTPLNIVHRDISPQNIIVGRDGVARVLDFGVAKAAGRVHETKDGAVKGKFAYMAPEQLGRTEVDRRTDIFAAAIVLWETLTSERLFDGDNLAEIVHAVMSRNIAAPSSVAPEIPHSLDEVTLKGLERDVMNRFPTAKDMAVAIEQACRPASPREVGEWVQFLAASSLRASSALIERIESETTVPPDIPSAPDLGEMSSAVTANPRSPEPSLSGSHARPTSGGQVPSGSGSHGGQLVQAGVAQSTASGGQNTSSGTHNTSTGTRAITRQRSLLQPFRESISAWWKALGVLALFTVIALALLFAGINLHRFFVKDRVLSDGPTEVAPSASAPQPSASPPSASVAPASSGVQVPAAPSETAPPAPSAAPSASAAATESAPTAAPTETHRHRSRPAASADCENPFIIDSNGIKRPKPQCFGNK